MIVIGFTKTGRTAECVFIVQLVASVTTAADVAMGRAGRTTNGTATSPLERLRGSASLSCLVVAVMVRGTDLIAKYAREALSEST
jgi:hypothetical protein